jgi:hypothetical protein
LCAHNILLYVVLPPPPDLTYIRLHHKRYPLENRLVVAYRLSVLTNLTAVLTSSGWKPRVAILPDGYIRPVGYIHPIRLSVTTRNTYCTPKQKLHTMMCIFKHRIYYCGLHTVTCVEGLVRTCSFSYRPYVCRSIQFARTRRKVTEAGIKTQSTGDFVEKCTGKGTRR